MTLVDDIQRLYSTGRQEDAFDLLYDKIDIMLSFGNFEEVDALLRNLDVEQFEIALLLGFLTITGTARQFLKERAGLCARIRARIQASDPDRVDALLAGLE